LIGAGRCGRQGLIQAEVVTDDHVARGRRRAEVRDELAQELVQLAGVDSHDETSPWLFGVPSRLRLPASVAAALQSGCNGLASSGTIRPESGRAGPGHSAGRTRAGFPVAR